MKTNTSAAFEFPPIKYVPLLVPLLGLLQLVGALLILVGALGGCAAIERQQAADTEKLLATAGFQIRPADSAERQQDLANMPPLEIVAHREGGKTVYTYADAQTCRCLYVGGAKAYAEYGRLAVSEEIARDMSAASMNAASMNWDVWGSWDPRWAPSAF
jgi:hypothetical protein